MCMKYLFSDSLGGINDPLKNYIVVTKSEHYQLAYDKGQMKVYLTS